MVFFLLTSILKNNSIYGTFSPELALQGNRGTESGPEATSLQLNANNEMFPVSKKILHINSFHPGFFWSDSITRGILTTLTGKNIDLYTEYLYARHFKESIHELNARYIANKYRNVNFDLVIVSDNEALDFAFEYGDRLFPSIPVVFCGIINEENYKFENSRFYGFIENASAQKTIKLISKLFKDTKQVLIITDNTAIGEHFNKGYKAIEHQFPNLKLNFIEELDVDSLMEIVKSGDKGDVVMLHGIFRDKYGNALDYLELHKKIIALSPKPVFCNGDQDMGLGIIGGYINKGIEQGTNAAGLALRFLKNPSLTGVAHINRVNEVAYFDQRVLSKFNVPKSLIPNQSIILYKPHFKYWRIIKILLAIAVVLLFIVFILVFNIRKRVAAEKKAQDQMLEIQDQNAQLEESYQLLSEMNAEMEETNTKLYNTNESLIETMRKVEESERLKASFLANMSHEIRTPLNAIVGFSTLLVDTENNPEKRENFVNIINSNSEALLILIDDILDLSKLEAGQLTLRFEKVDVMEIFMGLLQFIELRNTKKIEVRFAPGSNNNPIWLITDKVRFRQILTNLLTNSLKFTEQGFIEMGYHANSNEITFWVKDTGIGIEEQYLESIFDRFVKIQSNHDKFYPGTGLGLAITKRLVEMLGGKIWLESKPGEGSVFYFTHKI